MFTSIEKFPLKTILIFLIAIISMNVTYYQHSKALLMNKQKEQINIFSSTLASAINNESEGEATYEEMLARSLRTASIAIQNSIDPDFHKVTNDNLVELTKLLGLDGITLFERRGDDFIGVRSSEPKEINASSKTWGIVYDAHLQLSERKSVDIGTGLTLEDFWSGPIDTASTDESNIRKWGYYYDGTTNYLINPYLNVSSSLARYRDKMGVDVSIKELLNNNKDNLLEIAVLNSEKINKNGPTPFNRDNFYSERLIENGSYDYRDGKESEKITEAIETNKPVFYEVNIKGETILKSFTPITTSNLKYKKDELPKVVMIATDYSTIRSTLDKQFNDVIFFMSIVTLLVLIVIFFLLIFTRKKNEGVVKSVQDVYLDNINSVVQSIKEQRHDIINHITTIYWMLSLKKYESAQEYIMPLIQDAKMMENKIKVIEINVPAICAIVQAKLAQSEVHNIDMQVDFKNMENLQLTAIETTVLVRILSNLIDNAFEATCELPDLVERKVYIEGTVHSSQLIFKVQNSCEPISPGIQERMFEPGFSTKSAKKNKGLGLHIIKELIKSYKGSINFTVQESGVVVSVVIPLNDKSKRHEELTS